MKKESGIPHKKIKEAIKSLENVESIETEMALEILWELEQKENPYKPVLAKDEGLYLSKVYPSEKDFYVVGYRTGLHSEEIELIDLVGTSALEPESPSYDWFIGRIEAHQRDFDQPLIVLKAKLA